MSATYPTKIILALRSGNRCALPDCGLPLLANSGSGEPTVIGEAAHIAGENPGGKRGGGSQRSARYDPNMTDDQRNSYDNLIYLCANCHTKIDKIPQGETDYPVARLLQIKGDHESRVREGIAQAFATLGFPELEEATKWIEGLPAGRGAEDFSLIEIEEKLQKNGLGNDSRNIIRMSLAVARQVSEFVEGKAQVVPDFPKKLKHGFLREYSRLIGENKSGDELFGRMCLFAQRGHSEVKYEMAGVAVMVYLFEACEIFEK